MRTYVYEVHTADRRHFHVVAVSARDACSMVEKRLYRLMSEGEDYLTIASRLDFDDFKEYRGPDQIYPDLAITSVERANSDEVVLDLDYRAFDDLMEKVKEVRDDDEGGTA